MTDLAHLPPLPPIARSRANLERPTLIPSGHDEDLATGMTDLAHLPPLHPMALRRTNQAGPTNLARRALFPSGHGEDLAAGTTVLMAGLVALAWALRLDPTDGQVLVAASASFTLVAPVAIFTLLRSASHRSRPR
jgi:hypothetical protein